jgi:predicted TIM-barrel fold metal-dependent hydrolase
MSQVIDADGHIIENESELLEHLEPPYRGEQALLKFSLFPSLDGFHRVARRLASGTRTLRPDAFMTTAQTWIDFLDRTGIETTVVYPTHGLGFGLITDPEWACGLAIGYNNWLSEQYLKVTPRIRGVALIPLQAPSEAVKELKRVVTQLGMVGAVLPAVGLEKPLGHSDFWPIYEEAERLDVPIAIHGAPSRGLGIDFFKTFIEVHTLSHPLGQLIQMTSLVFQGVFDRFPKLRVAFLEAGAGWVPYMMDRLDEEYDVRGVQAPGLKVRPSEHLKSGRVFFPCEEEEDVPYLARRVGARALVFASDYPHERSWEAMLRRVKEFTGRDDLDDALKAQILNENPRRLYRL